VPATAVIKVAPSDIIAFGLYSGSPIFARETMSELNSLMYASVVSFSPIIASPI
jgi:bifunctional DNase/RNase